jgi:hypothetical protein
LILSTLGAKTGKSVGVEFEDVEGDVAQIEARQREE